MVLDAWHDKWDDFSENPPLEKDLPHPLKRRESPESGRNDAVTDQDERPKQPDPMSYGDHELRDEGTQSHTDQSS